MASVRENSSGLLATSCSNHAAETSSANRSRGKFRKGKESTYASEVKWLSERLKNLEEEAEVMKQAFMESLEERKKLMNEIHQLFQAINRHLRRRKQLRGDISSDRRAVTGLSQVLHLESNPSLVIRDLKVTMGAFEEPSDMHEFSS